jgi:hypothetical protein
MDLATASAPIQWLAPWTSTTSSGHSTGVWWAFQVEAHSPWSGLYRNRSHLSRCINHFTAP